MALSKPTVRKPKEQIAAEKSHREKMYSEIREVISNNGTRERSDDYFDPTPNKLVEYYAINGISAIKNVARRTAALTAIYNSLGSGYSVRHVEKVYNDLRDLRLTDDEAGAAISPETLLIQRQVLGDDAYESSVEKITASYWVMTLDEETRERAVRTMVERGVFSRPEIETLIVEMNQNAAPLSAGTL